MIYFDMLSVKQNKYRGIIIQVVFHDKTLSPTSSSFFVRGGRTIWMNGTDGMDGTDGTDGTEGKYEANGEMSWTNELDVLDG